MPSVSRFAYVRTPVVRTFVAPLAVLIVCSASAWAQGGASVGGVVKDQSGAALPGTTVTVLNTGTGAAQTLVAGPSGNYLAVNLQPGQYQVTAELSGGHLNVHLVAAYRDEQQDVTLQLQEP